MTFAVREHDTSFCLQQIILKGTWYKLLIRITASIITILKTVIYFYINNDYTYVKYVVEYNTYIIPNVS